MNQTLKTSWLISQVSLKQAIRGSLNLIRRWPLLPAGCLLILGLLWQWEVNTAQNLGAQLGMVLYDSSVANLQRASHLLAFLVLSLAWGLYLLTKHTDQWASLKHLPIEKRAWLIGTSLPLLACSYLLGLVLIGPLWAALATANGSRLGLGIFGWWLYGLLLVMNASQLGLATATIIDKILSKLFQKQAIFRYFTRQLAYVGFLGEGLVLIVSSITKHSSTYHNVLLNSVFGSLGDSNSLLLNVVRTTTSLFLFCFILLISQSTDQTPESLRIYKPRLLPGLTQIQSTVAITFISWFRHKEGLYLIILFSLLPLSTAVVVRLLQQPLLTALFAQLCSLLIPLAVVFIPAKMRRQLSQVSYLAYVRPLAIWRIVIGQYLTSISLGLVISATLWAVCFMITGLPLTVTSFLAILVGVLPAVCFSLLLGTAFSQQGSAHDLSLVHSLLLVSGLMIIESMQLSVLGLGLWLATASTTGFIITSATLQVILESYRLRNI